MKKQIKKTLLSVLFGGLAIVGGNLCVLQGWAQGEAVWEDVAIGEYNIGNEFVVPERTVNVSGVDYETNAKVIMPDGKATSQDVVVFEQAGKYAVEYFTEVNGVPYVKTEYIYIQHNAYRYSDENTVVSYMQKGEYPYSPDSDGLLMSIQQGDKVVVQQTIEIPYEDTDVCLTSFFVAPQLRGASDMKRIRFRFEDAYDASSYVEVVLNGNYYDRESGFWMGGSYALVAAAGQTLKAYDADKGSVITDQGAGSYLYSSFYALDYQKNTVDPSKYCAYIYFNPVTCELSAGDCGNKGIAKPEERMKTVIDTNSVEHQGVDEPLWNGFASGKVKMTVSAEEYVSSSANLVFTYIKDTDLTNAITVDGDGPRITVDCEYDAQEMPEARVGASCWYPVPSASAIDLYSGKCDVKTYVYFNYLSNGAYLKEIKNGAFCVDEEGQYAIVYRAYDWLGNLSEVVLPVHAGREIEEWDIEISQDKTVLATVGDCITLAVPEYSGGSGKTALTATVNCDTKTFYFDGSLAEWSFVVDSVGEWEVIYSATDYTGDVYEESYTLTVEPNASPIFKSVPILPPVYVEGFRYMLPKAEVYVANGNTIEVKDAYVEVTAANETKRYNGGDEFVPIVENHGDCVSIVYKYEENGQTASSAPVEIPVARGFDENKYGDKILNTANFFYDAQGTFRFEKKKDGSFFTIDNQDAQWTGDSIWTYANPLAADGFTLSFSTLSEFNGYDGFVFSFTDSENPAVRVSGRLYKNQDGQFGLVFGGGNGTLKLNCDQNNDLALSLTGNKLSIDGGAIDVACVASVDDNGNAFTNFPSGKVYFSFGLENAKVGAKYKVYLLGGHVFANLSKDTIAPKVYLSGDYAGTVGKNGVYLLCAATASDVIAPNVRLTVSVTAPDGSFAKDVNGVALENVSGWISHQVKVEQIGEYKVAYNAYEDYENGNFNQGQENKGSFEYSFFVLDDKAPQLTVQGNVPTKVKAGAKVSVPDVTAQDDFSSADKISVRIFVTSPYGRTEYVANGAFVCSEIGVYQLRIVAVDEAGNATSLIYEITVTK